VEKVEFTLSELIIGQHDNNAIININVEFEEESTGRRQNASTEVQVHENIYNVEIGRFSNNFKPNDYIYYFVKILDHDGKPIIEKDKKITIQINFEGSATSLNVDLPNVREKNFHSFEVKNSLHATKAIVKVIVCIMYLNCLNE
jgi:hypothetical protein